MSEGECVRVRRAAREEARGHIDLNHVERHFRSAAALDPQGTWASSFAKELSLVGTHFRSTATCTRLLSAILVLPEPNFVEGIVDVALQRAHDML